MARRSGKWRVQTLTVEEAFGQVLRELRRTHGLSQEQLGLELDSGRTYISELERGVRAPTVKWVFRIGGRFGTPPSGLLRQVELLEPDLMRLLARSGQQISRSLRTYRVQGRAAGSSAS